VCKFYEPTTGGCFKGGRCKLKHLPEHRDGYEKRDKVNILYNIPTKVIHNGFQNSRQLVKIVSFVTLSKFYCRYQSSDEADNDFLKLVQQMNSAEEMELYEKYEANQMLVENQPIIVNVNGVFYRAIITELEDMEGYYEVFLVDKGEFHHIKTIYKSNMRYQKHDYMAIEMEMIGIEAENAEEGIELIMKIQAMSNNSLEVDIVYVKLVKYIYKIIFFFIFFAEILSKIEFTCMILRVIGILQNY
jgi:hypothetical protein